ncbi:hypothetical protein [Melissospora conviva]|uniref:hypothetical protein n=1 Tax=Melissospora conviva TaxID=3388432 RepID=UPI003C1C6C16
MTAHRVTEVRCDRPGCDNAWLWEGNAADVRRMAARNGGWVTGRPGGTDYCGNDCRPNH